MAKDIHNNCILILDFGSQYTKLIVRRIRELGVYCESFTWDATESQIRKFNPSGIILSGSPESTTKGKSPYISKYIFEAGIPILGICYGMQIMVMQLGGQVETSNKREFGYTQVEIKIENILTKGIEDSVSEDGKKILDVWMSHNDKVTTIPLGFITVASTKSCPFAIIANNEKRFYGVQFHPEVTHTRQGTRIIKRFIYEVCQCQLLWIPRRIINDVINNIKRRIGNDKVILGLSGGIDSSVTAILLHRAINKNLTCIFIDNGLLCLNEAKKAIDIFEDQFNLNIIKISAEERFLEALKGKNEPEEKRKIIGHLFMQIFEEEALKIKGVKWFAQGTIYPDIIESAMLNTVSSKVQIIKSHHNVGGLPKNIKIKLIEPLKDLFKDEVRKIGLELGIPYNIVYHHPFPGVGLGVRVLGEVKKEYCNLLRKADLIFVEELKKANLYDKLSQAFTVFLPLRSVGIMGDNREYNWVISLRAVETIDFMTANWAHLPYDVLSRVSNRIINEINGISRVVYDISDKPPSTIEWE